MGQNSQPAPWLGRRPSTITTSRIAPTLATVTVCTTATVRPAATSRSAPLSVSAKRDMSMINQQIRARRAAAHINILVRAQIKLEVAEQPVVGSIRLALAPVDISGVLVVVFDIVTVIILTKNIAQITLLLILAMMEA